MKKLLWFLALPLLLVDYTFLHYFVSPPTRIEISGETLQSVKLNPGLMDYTILVLLFAGHACWVVAFIYQRKTGSPSH